VRYLGDEETEENMKFITIRDLRSRSAEIQKLLPGEREMVLTSNGRPVAIMTAVNESTLEPELRAIRAARAIMAVNAVQAKSLRSGKSAIKIDEINKEVSAVRTARKKQ
jgi:antitoxin (DNA-binding transcriptional repressor) of toxin-antitoxin stability system